MWWKILKAVALGIWQRPLCSRCLLIKVETCGDDAQCTVQRSTQCTEVPSSLFSWAPQQLILDPSVAVVCSIYSFLSIVFIMCFLYYIPSIHTKFIASLCMFSACSSIHSLFGGGLRVCVLPESSVQARKHILEIHTRDWNPKMAEPFIDELAEKCVGKSASQTVHRAVWTKCFWKILLDLSCSH